VLRSASCFASPANEIRLHSRDQSTRRANHQSLSTPPRKIFRLTCQGKSVVRIRPSHRHEGRLAIVTDERGGGSVDAGVATDERDSADGEVVCPDAAVLASSS